MRIIGGWRPVTNRQHTLARIIQRAQARHAERERAVLESPQAQAPESRVPVGVK